MPPSPKARAIQHLSDGRQALGAGEPRRAHTAFKAAIELDETLAAAHYELGNSWRRAGRPALAEMCLQAAIRYEPTLVDAYISLAFLYHEQGSSEQAGAVIMALLNSPTNDTKLHSQMGALLADFGCYADASKVFERLALLTPQAPLVYQQLGQMYQKLGRYASAAAAFQRCTELDPDSGAAYLLLAHTRRIGTADMELIECLEHRLRDPSLSRNTIICLYFALGKLHDDLSRYTDAFRHFKAGNRLKSEQQPFDQAAWTRQIQALTQTYTGNLNDQLKRVKPTLGPRPVFVVGMLRSGTTLLERILARHPEVYGAGELDLLDALAARASQISGASYPQCVLKLTPAQIAQLGAEYKAHWPQQARRASVVVDKNPLNFIHLALAALVLPEARFIHCERNPLDTCLSIYFQNFAHARNSYAYRLDDLLCYYRGYRALMAHWEQVLPGRIHAVRYEALVEQPEPVTRKLLAALELAWHPDCLEPHRHTGSISTASIWQARQPIYRRSVGRWRHYRDYIQPLLDALGE